MAGRILFFDGDCGFCSKSVRFLARRDRLQRLSFAPLQGEWAKEKGFAHEAARAGGTMVVVRESDGRVFLRSDAVIEVARALGGFWKLLIFAKWIPRSVRDRLYQWVADNRFRWVQNLDSCRLPDPEVVKRLRS